MKRKIVNTIFAILVVQSISVCQIPTFEIEYRDTNYLNEVILENGDSTDIWKLKDDLKKGKYVVVTFSKCGKDTLMSGEFIQDNVKHGKWIEWEGRFCGGFVEKDGFVANWNFFGEPEVNQVIFYKGGFIKKKMTYDLIHAELIYPEGVTKFNQWVEEKVWDEDGNLRWHKKINKNGLMEHTDFYENGKVRSKGELESHGTFQEAWEYFYPNGIMMAKGKFEEFGKGKVIYYTGQRTPKDEWIYWDKSGNKIAKIFFENGEISTYEKYQDKEIPFFEIEEMVNEK